MKPRDRGRNPGHEERPLDKLLLFLPCSSASAPVGRTRTAGREDLYCAVVSRSRTIERDSAASPHVVGGLERPPRPPPGAAAATAIAPTTAATSPHGPT